MREAIGGTWLFGLVITFIVFFASFLAISINYAKVFNVKNNIVDIISKYEGNNATARNKIGEYLKDVGYLVSGNCEDYTPYGLDGNEMYYSDTGYYCIKEEKITTSTLNINKKYYKIKVFFRIDLPLVGKLTQFPIKGETEVVYYPTDN